MSDWNMKNETLDYSIVRALPDLLRGEMINFALIGAAHGQLFLRTSGVTRCLEAILNDSQMYACQHFSELIHDMTSQGYPETHDGKLEMSPIPGKAFLDHLHFQGISGFLVDEPRVISVAGTSNRVHEVFEDLFVKLILPIKKVPFGLLPSRSRARTIVNKIIDDVDIDRKRLLTNVVIKDVSSANSYQLDFAYANGKTTLGQSVDLDTQPVTQAKSIDHAIANIAEVQRVLGARGTQWLSVVQLARGNEESESLIQRLKGFSHTVVLPDDKSYFEQLIRREATSDVRKVLSAKGELIELSGKGVELVVSGPSEETFLPR